MLVYHLIQGHLESPTKSPSFTDVTYSYRYDPRAFSGNLPASWPAFGATYLYLVVKLVC